METALIVKVAVSAAPYAVDKPYDYLVPELLEERAVPGVRVTVPFGRGNRPSEGLVLARSRGEKVRGLKPLSEVLDDAPVLDGAGISLALWLRQRYFCTLFEAARAILPAGLWYRLREIWRLETQLEEALEAGRAVKRGGDVLEALSAAGGSAEYETLREKCGEETLCALRGLEALGLVRCETDASRKVTDKKRRMAELAVPAEEALAAVEAKRRSAPVRYEAVRFLAAAGRSACADVCYFTGATSQTLKGLERSGLVAFTEEEALRLPELPPPQPEAPIRLNEEQQRAFDEIRALLASPRAEAVLLHGVTGSGKTQVYLQLVGETLDAGRTAIVLVPEIVLTPQMMRKFSARFGSSVAMLHSSLRLTERCDQWKRVRRGEVKVVLGTRSAIFAPLKNLGLVILDEEQEGSYQSENPPRYHTRDVAKYLCARDKATLLLGSATPAVESAWRAERGIYRKSVLRRRYNEHALPKVVIADLREELRAGNSGTIGAALRRELEANLRSGEQSILFLNRRGNSRMLLCGECGHVPECPRCSVPMTYHSANDRLMCHYCGHSQRTMETCPDCGGIMKRVGSGTQKVEEELRELFPDAGILRMDADTTASGHDKLLAKFEKERVPILLGTQMVAKGLDFENVTLVGVLAADLGLYVDHYRAAERTFSLLTQVVGRAGRGGKLGRAVIQTYTPENDVILSAAAQDYRRFFNSEIRLRRLRRYPPFADLFTLTLSGIEEGAVLRAAARVRESLRHIAAAPELRPWEPEVLGPAPAPILKLNNRYRYRLLLVGKNDKPTRDYLSWLLKDFAQDRANRGVQLFVDCNGPD